MEGTDNEVQPCRRLARMIPAQRIREHQDPTYLFRPLIFPGCTGFLRKNERQVLAREVPEEALLGLGGLGDGSCRDDETSYNEGWVR